jgi:hypothetical protein
VLLHDVDPDAAWLDGDEDMIISTSSTLDMLDPVPDDSVNMDTEQLEQSTVVVRAETKNIDVL